MLRANRMSPHGSAARRKARSSPDSDGPATPVMKARTLMGGRISPGTPKGSSARSVLLDDAVAAGRFQVFAQLIGLLDGGERSDHGAEPDAFAAEVDAADDRLATVQHAGVFLL